MLDRKRFLGTPGLILLTALLPVAMLMTNSGFAQVERVSILVHLEPGTDRGPVRGFAASQGGVVRYEYTILPNVINLRNIPVPALSGLEQLPGVTRIEEDGIIQGHLNDSTALINALQSQIAAANLPADGSGVRVCVVDSGIDSDHIMYATRIDAAAGFDFVNNDPNPEDDDGHGAHVAGIAVGGTGLSVDFDGDGDFEPFQGIAPEATLIGVKVLNASGSGSASDVIAGIGHCADPAQADVINMSLGGGDFSGTCDSDSVASAANNAVAAGVVVVSSSGNGGKNNSLPSPACGSQVISVGATYDDNFPNADFPDEDSFTFCTKANPRGLCTKTCTDNSPGVDEPVCFSNQSDTLNVTAPGCLTFSAFADSQNNSIIGFCGTSMASPHVAGLAALLLSADPLLTPAQVRQLIRDGAIDFGSTGFDNTFGYGRIDAVGSLSLMGACVSLDLDFDGFFGNCGGNDCNDNDASINPGAPEFCGDGKDNNCDGTIDEGCGGGGNPTAIHVEEIVLTTQDLGRGFKNAQATVTILDDLGQPVLDAIVTGNFSGDINEMTVMGTTNANGQAVLTTTGQVHGRLEFTFCVDVDVDGVSGALPYEPGDNVETCDSN